MRVYLDTCGIQRPLDTPTQTRIRLEGEAILGVLKRVEDEEVELVSSTVLELEISRNTLPARREHGEQVLSRAKSVVVVDDHIAERAREFVQHGVHAMDALHLASAERAQADYFCTCDNRFLRRAQALPDLRTTVVTPIELIEIIES